MQLFSSYTYMLENDTLYLIFSTAVYLLLAVCEKAGYGCFWEDVLVFKFAFIFININNVQEQRRNDKLLSNTLSTVCFLIFS